MHTAHTQQRVHCGSTQQRATGGGGPDVVLTIAASLCECLVYLTLNACIQRRHNTQQKHKTLPHPTKYIHIIANNILYIVYIYYIYKLIIILQSVGASTVRNGALSALGALLFWAPSFIYIIIIFYNSCVRFMMMGTTRLISARGLRANREYILTFIHIILWGALTQ